MISEAEDSAYADEIGPVKTEILSQDHDLIARRRAFVKEPLRGLLEQETKSSDVLFRPTMWNIVFISFTPLSNAIYTTRPGRSLK